MKRIAPISAALLGLLLIPSAVSAMAPHAPVTKFRHATFGPVLVTTKKQALYYWNIEKRAGGKVRCKGACARAWPPLIVKSRSAVPRRIAGIPGRFGVIRRPDGRLQVTHRGLPVYSYAHEAPEQVLCNNVDGWFVVRL